MFAIKTTEKISDLRNIKKLSFIGKKTTKAVESEKYLLSNYKSVITVHSKTSYKLAKTIRQAEKVSQVGSNSSLHSDNKKVKILSTKKM